MLPAVVVYGGGKFYAFSVTHSQHVRNVMVAVAHNS